MAAPADSSGSLPLADDAGAASHRDLLASPELRRSIAVVARRRGVEGDAIEDVVQETLTRALRQPLPQDRTEARKYIHGIAKRVALDIVRDASSDTESLDDDGPDVGSEYDYEGSPHAAAAYAQPVRFDDRDETSKVIAAGEHRFPRSFSYFLQARVLGHSAEEIANDHDVAPGNVRRQIMEMQEFVSDYRTRLAASIALVLLIVAGWAAWRDPTREWAKLTPHPVTEPAPLEGDALADHLRERARRACNAGASAACLADIDAADSLDSIGAPSWSGLRNEAEREMMVHESRVDWDRLPGPEDKRPAPGGG